MTCPIKNPLKLWILKKNPKKYLILCYTELAYPIRNLLMTYFRFFKMKKM